MWTCLSCVLEQLNHPDSRVLSDTAQRAFPSRNAMNHCAVQVCGGGWGHHVITAGCSITLKAALFLILVAWQDPALYLGLGGLGRVAATMCFALHPHCFIEGVCGGNPRVLLPGLILNCAKSEDGFTFRAGLRVGPSCEDCLGCGDTSVCVGYLPAVVTGEAPSPGYRWKLQVPAMLKRLHPASTRELSAALAKWP